MPTNNHEPAKHDRLKQRLLAVGIAIPGTIHALYARCGSPSCPCAKDDTKRHGPYHRWHYRDNGRLVAKGIDPDMLSLFREWIQNREALDLIVRDILESGARHALSTAAGKTPTGNSGKTGRAMRGK